MLCAFCHKLKGATFVVVWWFCIYLFIFDWVLQCVWSLRAWILSTYFQWYLPPPHESWDYRYVRYFQRQEFVKVMTELKKRGKNTYFGSALWRALGYLIWMWGKDEPPVESPGIQERAPPGRCHSAQFRLHLYCIKLTLQIWFSPNWKEKRLLSSLWNLPFNLITRLHFKDLLLSFLTVRMYVGLCGGVGIGVAVPKEARVIGYPGVRVVVSCLCGYWERKSVNSLSHCAISPAPRPYSAPFTGPFTSW